ncbi:MAG TPA: phage head-tail connector protein [Spongiibacteraceae bacterium]|nr:phage head-tail connector protein [Spongiibacteraceae bacterium]
MMLVTLQEASDHLRRDTDDDDPDLGLKIHAASGAVMNYLKREMMAYEPERDSMGNAVVDSNGWPLPQLDSSGEPVPRFEVKAAVLLMLGELYKNREGEQGGEIPTQWGYGYLPRPVVALLYPLRDPALA